MSNQDFQKLIHQKDEEISNKDYEIGILRAEIGELKIQARRSDKEVLLPKGQPKLEEGKSVLVLNEFFVNYCFFT